MGLKIACPGCAKTLVAKQNPPFRLRCPGCRTRLQVAASGTVRTLAESPGGEEVSGEDTDTSPGRGSALLLASIGGGVLAVGLVVLIVVLGQGRGAEQPAPPAGEAPIVDLGPAGSPPPPVRIEETTFAAWAVAKGEPLPATVRAAAGKEGDPGSLPLVKGPAPTRIVLTSADGHPGVDGPAVNAAIDKGINYLRKSKNGSPGLAALAGLTLLSCGVPAEDEDVRWFAEQVRKGAPTIFQTYHVASCIWFLDKLNDPADGDLIRSLALHLIASQKPRGGWDYSMVRLTPEQQGQLLDILRGQDGTKTAAPSQPKDSAKDTQAEIQALELKLRDLSKKRTLAKTAAERNAFMTEMRDLMAKMRTLRGSSPRLFGTVVADLRSLPAITYVPGEKLAARPAAGHEDNSLTQFAVLALWAAQKHGVPAGRSLAIAEAHFRETQSGAGSWGYTRGDSIRSDSMTCAGLLGLAVGRGSRLAAAGSGTATKEADPAIENGLRHITQRLQAMGAKTTAGTAPADPLPDPAVLQKMMTELFKKRVEAKTPAEQAAVQQAILDLQTRMRAALPVRAGGLVGANAWGDLYFLWSLERMAVVYDLRTIGGYDWYAFGAPRIVAAQRPDGSWSAGHQGVPDTCFALLFLKRTNVVQTLTVALQGLGLTKDAGERGQSQGQPTFIRGAGQMQGSQNTPQLQGTNKLQ